ncbi:hypothetical protein ACQ4LE_003595 [Meloidogyne hapla]|uniref:EKC/KEOPS complex subunit GON7 n=1 Tax=Meloidogyne hapla TaxID=6305 RepID=A0A1I8BBM8_MELHA
MSDIYDNPSILEKLGTTQSSPTSPNTTGAVSFTSSVYLSSLVDQLREQLTEKQKENEELKTRNAELELTLKNVYGMVGNVLPSKKEVKQDTPGRKEEDVKKKDFVGGGKKKNTK